MTSHKFLFGGLLHFRVLQSPAVDTLKIHIVTDREDITAKLPGMVIRTVKL